MYTSCTGASHVVMFKYFFDEQFLVFKLLLLQQVTYTSYSMCYGENFTCQVNTNSLVH